MVLSLSTQLVLVYAGIVALGAGLGGLGTILLESGHVNSTVRALSDTIEENELGNLVIRLRQITATSADLFAQFVSNVEYQRSYATEVFNSSLPVVSFYRNYHVLEPEDLPPDLTDVSFWYQRSYSDGGALSEYLNRSSLLDDSHGPLFKSASFYVPGLYMGFPDGLYRHYPYLTDAVSYPTNEYICEIDQSPITGYDPRCRIWYVLANADRDNFKITQPYIDATTGLVTITVSRAVVVGSTFYGVVASDISMQYLSDVVLSAEVLDSGYAYLCDGQKRLVVHPDIDINSGVVFSVGDKEFSKQSERDAFNALLEEEVFQGRTGQTSFTKGGDKWYATYAPVSGTDYFMLMVVPEEEILEPATVIESYAASSITILTVVIIIVGVVALAAGTYVAVRLAKKIAEPVEIFNKVLSDIAGNNLTDTDHGETTLTSDYREINALHGKIKNLFMAVKFSTEAYFSQDYVTALAYLDEVESMFEAIQQKRALGVINNNRGNILRNLTEDVHHFKHALEALQAAVENIRLFVAHGEEALANIRDKNGAEAEALAEDAALQLIQLKSVLANRLSNYGDCLRAAGKFEEALEALTESHEMFASVDDLSGMINTLGNKGLVFMDLSDHVNAERIFLEANQMACDGFQALRNEKNIKAVQYSHMNLGLHFYKVSTSGARIDMRALEMALNQFYTTLTVSDRIQKVVQTTCLLTLEEIFSKYYSGEVGEMALQKLYSLYPSLQSRHGTINFVIDVSPSMSGPRIRSCEETLLDIVRNQMHCGDGLSITTFATDITNLVPFCRLNKTNVPDVLDTIKVLPSMTMHGRTHFYKTLLSVGNSLMSQDLPQRWVVALTDGEDNEGGHSRRSQAKDFYVQNDIKLIIIAVGLGGNARTLETLRALATEPSYFIVAGSDSHQITEALKYGFEIAQSGNVVMESL